MSLSSRTVEDLFGRLYVRYGSAWTAKWTGLPELWVKQDWAMVLSGLDEETLLYGLEHLPTTFPPNATEFNAICRGRPVPAERLLRPPKADPARVAEAMAKLGQPKTEHPLDWARRLRDKEEAGEFLTFACRDAWRSALEHEIVPNNPDDFKPIPVDVLPASMRPDAHTIAPDGEAAP